MRKVKLRAIEQRWSIMQLFVDRGCWQGGYLQIFILLPTTPIHHRSSNACAVFGRWKEMSHQRYSMTKVWPLSLLQVIDRLNVSRGGTLNIEHGTSLWLDFNNEIGIYPEGNVFSREWYGNLGEFATLQQIVTI